MSSYGHIKVPGLSKWPASVRQSTGLLTRISVQNLMAIPKDWNLPSLERLKPDKLLTSLTLILWV